MLRVCSRIISILNVFCTTTWWNILHFQSLQYFACSLDPPCQLTQAPTHLATPSSHPPSELEQEEEEEEEVEREVPSVHPLPESNWPYHQAVTAQKPQDLAQSAGLLRLVGAIIPPLGPIPLEPRSLGRISWAPEVWLTAGFMRAADLPPGAPANSYLRHVDALLALPR